MTSTTTNRRQLGRASRTTLGANFGVIEPRGLYVAGLALRAR